MHESQRSAERQGCYWKLTPPQLVESKAIRKLVTALASTIEDRGTQGPRKPPLPDNLRSPVGVVSSFLFGAV